MALRGVALLAGSVASVAEALELRDYAGGLARRKETLAGGVGAWVSLGGSSPSGVAALFHGCTHAGDHWFVLPEEVRFLQALLASGYAILSYTTPEPGDNYCWPMDGATVTTMAAAHRELTARLGLASLPSLGVGGSSGGNFVSLLSEKVAFNALAIWVSPTAYARPRDAGGVRLPASFPPVVFSFMHKDTRWASEANCRRVCDALSARAVPCEAHGSRPRALTAELVADAMVAPGVPPAGARALVAALAERGLLGPAGGLLVDPRAFPWRDVAATALSAHVSLQDAGLFMGLEELLNVCWAQHEFTHEHVGAVLAFAARQGLPAPAKPPAVEL